MKKILSLLFFFPALVSAQSQRQTVYSAAPICTVQGFVPLSGGGNLLAGTARYASDSAFISFIFLNDSDEIVSQKDFNTATDFDFLSCIIPVNNGFLLGGKSSDTTAYRPQLIRTD